jgi:hypothetical protein
MLRKKIIVLFPMFLGAILLMDNRSLSAQDLNKEVYVVRPYEPTLSDAVKFNFLPDNNQVETTIPHFNYSIAPKKLENAFTPDLIKPAKTVATSLPKIYNSWLKVGLGNYSTALAELNVSNVRSKQYAYGLYLYHKSSSGKVRLANDQKVPAGYGLDNVKLYGRSIYPKMKLTGDVRFDHHGFNYYGYNTGLYLDSVPDLDKDSLKMQTYTAGLDIGLASTFTDSSHLNYNLDLHYDYFWDKLKNNENRFRIEGGLNKSFNGLVGGLDVSLDYSKTKATLDSISNTVFRFSPWISKRSKDWKFLLGFETVADIGEITHYYFYPHASLDIIIIEKVLVPFIGLTGEFQKNSYMDLFEENTFIVPGLDLKGTSSNLIVYGGLKGSISSSVRFRADVSYTLLKDMHFFVNDTSGGDLLQNKFVGVYDEVDLITYHGQLVIQPSDKLNISLDGKYFDYSMLAEEKPWHKPDFRIDLDASYRFGKNFEVQGGFNFIGNRWIKNYYLPEGKEKLKPFADLNLKVNYNYSKALTIFANLYNMADRSYLIWSQYPAQRFNFLFGLSYKL